MLGVVVLGRPKRGAGMGKSGSGGKLNNGTRRLTEVILDKYTDDLLKQKKFVQGRIQDC